MTGMLSLTNKFILSFGSFLISSQLYIGDGLEDVQTRCQNGKNQKVFLVDNLLTRNEVKWLNGYMERHRPWILNQKDIFKESFLDLKSNTTWVSPVAVDIFERTRIWNELSKILGHLSGRKQYLCFAMFTLAYRLDFKPVSKDDCGLTVQIFLNEDMKKNDYGEAVFYNDNDVMCGIYQKPGRVIIWNSTISYILKPPSMLYVQSQNSLILTLADSLEGQKTCSDFNKATKEAILHSKPQNFPCMGKHSYELDCLQHGNINYEKHLTSKYYDSQGHEIAVFDDVLSQRDLHKLREYLTNDYHSFGFQAYDNDHTEDHDNVAWISVQKSDILAQTSFWQVIKQAAVFLSGLDQWYPYDVSMNIIHSFHHTRIHEDCEPFEHEYTFLLYLNPEWNENLFGETVFFEKLNSGKDVESGDEEYEIITAVKPRYGRIVMFRGIIPHSARPPSPGFQGARYTFACKVSKTFGYAKRKKLRETIEAFHEFGMEDDQIDFSKEFENYHGKRLDDVMNSELIRQKQKLDKLVQKRQDYFIDKLSETL